MLAREDCVVCTGKQENNDRGHFKKCYTIFSVAAYGLGYICRRMHEQKNRTRSGWEI